MRIQSRARRRAVAFGTAAATILALVAAAPLAAQADTKPVSSSTPTTVSSDSLSTAQLANGVGYAQTVIGSTVYVGGNFTGARAAGSSGTASTRSNLMAYDLTTGALKSFAPTLNGVVRSLTSSPDGSVLYVGGAFTTVNGVARSRIVALNPTTGAVLTGFAPTPNSQVNAIVATASTVYIGGQFTTVNSSTRTRAAAVSATTGALTTWAPSITDNAVIALSLNASVGRVALAGTFTTINGAKGAGFAMVDSSTGTSNVSTPIRSIVTDGSTSSAINSLTSDGTKVYATGYYSQQAPDGSGNLEGSFAINWSTGATTWLEDCHGDSYGGAVLNSVFYVVGHPHYCNDVDQGYPQSPSVSGNNPTYQRAIAFTTAASGTTLKTNTILQPRYSNFSGQPSPTQLSWFPTLAPGTFTGAGQGAYNIVASGNYLLLTGEFPSVNGTTQYGTARFAMPSIAPNTDGPQLSGSSWPVTATATASGSLRLAWLANYDRDNEHLTYTLYRGSSAISTQTADSRIWFKRPTLSFTDTGLTAGTSYSYKVVAADGYGNSATSATTTATAASSGVSAYARQVLADGATSYWRLGAKSGTSIVDSAGGYPAAIHGNVTLGAAGAISGDADTAATFDGAATTGIASTGYQGIGDTFSVSAWFKSTSRTGGEIIGAGDAQTQTTSTFTPPGGTPMTRTSDSGNHDREISTTADGHVTFTVYPGAQKTVTSAAAGYNDGKWHQVVGTLGTNGQVLFVDGRQVAADGSSTRALGMAQYWRIGGDSGYTVPDPTAPPGPPPASTPNSFTGTIDEPAVYVGTTLTAAQIAGQYSLAGGNTTTPTNAAPTASFTATVSGLAVALDGSSSTDSDGTVSSYAWNYGDGATGTGKTASHTYAAAGTYTVTLTVTDNGGATGTTTRSVTVGAATGTALASDAFGRTVPSGLGTADTGGAWTVTGGASSTSVGNGTANLSTAAGTNRVAVLSSVSATGVDVATTATFPTLGQGGSTYATVIARRIGTADYHASLIVSSAGVETLYLYRGTTSLGGVKLPGTVAAGGSVRIELQAVGTTPTTVRARVWALGSATPTTWQVTATDSTAELQAAGPVGLSSYQGSATTNGPIVVRFDDFAASRITG